MYGDQARKISTLEESTGFLGETKQAEVSSRRSESSQDHFFPYHQEH